MRLHKPRSCNEDAADRDGVMDIRSYNCYLDHPSTTEWQAIMYAVGNTHLQAERQRADEAAAAAAAAASN